MSGVRCAACDALLQPGFRFCAQCGRPVAHATEAPPAAAPPRPPPPRRTAPLSQGSAPPALRVAVVRSDGAAAALPLATREIVCGRTEGDLRLSDDATVSPRHLRFVPSNGTWMVEDLGSANGTFLRLRAPHRLATGEDLRLGRQLLRFEAIPRPPPGDVRPWGAPDPGLRFRLAQLLEDGGVGELYPLRPGENAIGRETGDVTFPGDRYVSARHARIDVGAEAVLTDLGSSNGTFVRLRAPAPIGPGDQLLVGVQLLRIEEG